MFQFQYAVRTHNGCVRGNNEDNYYVDGRWRRDVSLAIDGQDGTREGRLTALVCDGMGGADAGEVASRIAVETAAALAGEGPLLADGGRRYIDAANGAVCRYMDGHGLEMGSTLAALEFDGASVTSVNLGDSRCYLYRGGALQQLSDDHSVVARLLAAGLIGPEEARRHPRRHEITQYLGVRPEDMLLEPAVRRNIPLRNGDVWLVCSDGLTEALEDEAIGAVLGRGGTAGEAAEGLLAAALANRASDNVTVAVIRARKRPWGLDAVRRGLKGLGGDR